MDLFFDTYEQGTSVTARTRQLIGLLEIDGDLHAPPRCQFNWNELHFKAVIEKITQKFTMFLSDGTPVRSTLNVTFKEYSTLSEQLGNPPRRSSDRSKVRVFTEGDSLWLMSDREYGTPALWRKIARANGIDDPLFIEAGRELVIPPLE
jgi:nucleoid-associated protein YgaU